MHKYYISEHVEELERRQKLELHTRIKSGTMWIIVIVLSIVTYICTMEAENNTNDTDTRIVIDKYGKRIKRHTTHQPATCLNRANTLG